MKSEKIKYCSACGHAVQYRIPDDGDTRTRAICPACGKIHYVNPLMVTGTIPYLDSRILLCRRAIEPAYGLWTLPAGFMELGETLSEGAARETREESGAHFELGELFSIVSIPRAEQVHVFYLANLLNEELDPGIETLQARLFDLQDIPWDEIAFRTVRRSLECFVQDHRQGQYRMHDLSIS